MRLDSRNFPFGEIFRVIFIAIFELLKPLTKQGNNSSDFFLNVSFNNKKKNQLTYYDQVVSDRKTENKDVFQLFIRKGQIT